MATESITITFDPTAPPASQFAFTTSTGEPYLFADEDTEILVTLVGADFPLAPSLVVNWILVPPELAPPPPVATPTPDSVSFTVGPPPHHFVPWVFSFNVNFGGLINITSPLFYLVKHHDVDPVENPLEFTLAYTETDGSFTLLDESDTDRAAGVTLASKLILVNVFPVSLTILLTGATFNNPNPFVWSAGEQPIWITILSATDNAVTFSISDAANGQSTGLQFVVVVPDNQGQGLTILSPDPILINATIGDGG